MVKDGKELERARNGQGLVHAQALPENVWLANFLSIHTKRTYKDAVQEFISFLDIRDLADLRQVERSHVIAFRNALLARGLKPRTVYHRISAVSSLFKHLCEEQVASHNPATGVRRPRVEAREVTTPVLTPRRVRDMLEAAARVEGLRGLRDSVILHVLFYTGCRVNEVATLKVGDFFEDGGYQVLDFAIKGGRRNRIALHPELVRTLNLYIKDSGHGHDPDAPLVQPVQEGRKKRSLTSRRVSTIFKGYARLAGIGGNVRPHASRATFITQALDNGCPIEAVQRSVGHVRIDTTRMYDKRIAKYRESASFSVRY